MSEPGVPVNRRWLLQGTATALGTTIAGGSASASPRTEAPRAVTVRPGQAQYPDLVRGSNQRFVGTPEYVRLAFSTRDVEDAVREAVRTGKRLAVRSGGHCYEGFVDNPEVRVVLDLSGMDGIDHDPLRRAIAVEPGVSLLRLYDVLFSQWGVTIPAGSCHDVGVGGHLSGGGFGVWSRSFGLTADHLAAVEVVVVDRAGEVRTVIASGEPDDPNRDLWWAHTGGGGGVFGVVTRYWLRSAGVTSDRPERLLPRPPAEVFASSIDLPWNALDESGFDRLLANFGAFFERHSAPDSPYAGLYSMLLTPHRSNEAISLVTKSDATRPDSRQRLDTFLNQVLEGVNVPQRPATVALGTHPNTSAPTDVRRLPWLVATKGTDAGDPTARAKYKSARMRTGFPPAQRKVLHDALSEPDYANPLGFALIESYGGAVNAVPAGATAVPQRNSVLAVQYMAYWTDVTEDRTHLDWLRRLYRNLYADSGGVPVSGAVTDGCFVNFPDVDLADPELNTSGVTATELLYGAALPRLRKAKARWDPRGVFRHALSVPS